MPEIESQKGDICSVLGKTHLGAKRDFEIIWAFSFFSLWTPKAPLRMASTGSDLNIKGDSWFEFTGDSSQYMS